MVQLKKIKFGSIFYLEPETLKCLFRMWLIYKNKYIIFKDWIIGLCSSRALIDLAIIVYEPLTMLSKYGNCRRLLKIKNKLKIGCFYK